MKHAPACGELAGRPGPFGGPASGSASLQRRELQRQGKVGRRCADQAQRRPAAALPLLRRLELHLPAAYELWMGGCASPSRGNRGKGAASTLPARASSQSSAEHPERMRRRPGGALAARPGAAEALREAPLGARARADDASRRNLHAPAGGGLASSQPPPAGREGAGERINIFFLRARGGPSARWGGGPERASGCSQGCLSGRRGKHASHGGEKHVPGCGQTRKSGRRVAAAFCRRHSPPPPDCCHPQKARGERGLAAAK